MNTLYIDNLQLRKKLVTIYYDVLSVKEQIEVLNKLGISNKTSCAALSEEADLFHINVRKFQDAMKSYI